MSSRAKAWYSIGEPNDRKLDCASCGESIEVEFGDHHPRICPNCKVPCCFLDWERHPVQILTTDAPRALKAAIELFQDKFDELEFTELLCDLEELAQGLREKTMAQN